MKGSITLFKKKFSVRIVLFLLVCLMLISNVDVCIGLGHEEEGDIRTMDIELDFNDYSCGLTVVCIITINTNYLNLKHSYSRHEQ